MPLKIASHGICSQCVCNIPQLQAPCKRCGLPQSQPNEICYRCRENKPHWDKLVAVSDYRNPLKKMVHHLKFNQKTELTVSLARLMFLTWYQRHLQGELCKPDLVTCVPLHHVRYWSRGFNQAQLLAKPLAYWLNCNFSPYLIYRKKRARDQKQLSLSSRQNNVHALFGCDKILTGKSVMLIDDIVTTGSTINAISYQLRQQGAAQVHILCLCRTLL